ncbi:MAG: hypothetical protein JWP01_609 [Myxococcales bacterium]|nr:hypothetical protein [Myxococcales bacterium]
MKYALKLSMISVLAAAACGHTVKVQPITVEPIHMTIDINVHDGEPDADPGSASASAPRIKR